MENNNNPNVVEAAPENWKSFDVTVSSQTGWQDTGIAIEKGERLNIVWINGTWNGDGGRYPFHGPAGPVHDAYTAPDSYPLPGHVEDSLVGRVGGQRFFVGEQARVRIGENSTLQLTINDTGYHDNRGSIRVRVRVGD